MFPPPQYLVIPSRHNQVSDSSYPIQSIKIIKVVSVIIYSLSISFSVETGYVLNSFKSSSSAVAISNFGAISEKVKSENKLSFSISTTVFPSCSIEMILS